MQIPSALTVLYLDLLSVAALFWRGALSHAGPKYGFACLIPAHNEERLLPRLLDSLSAVSYPPDLYDVHVVADNCTDRTAAIAVSEGATVHARYNDVLVGKGYALQWLLERLD